MRSLLFTTALITALSVGSRPGPPSVPGQVRSATADDIAIWRAVATGILQRPSRSASYIVIVSRTGVACPQYSNRLCMDGRMNGRPFTNLQAELFDALAAVFAGVSIDVPDLGDERIRRVSAADLEPLDTETERLRAEAKASGAPVHPNLFWDLFHKRYSGSAGYLVVTAAAYDSARRQAAVHTHFSCGSLCGNGDLYLLSRSSGGEWTITARYPGWVS
jgi:hypothetical protein